MKKDARKPPTSGMVKTVPVRAESTESYRRDRRLLNRLKNGDHEAFMEVFRQWEEPLYRFLFNLTGSPEDAEDVSQEAFARLWENRLSVDISSNIQTYIFQIAKNIAWNQLRRDKIRNAVMSEVYDPGQATHSGDAMIIARETQLLTEYTVGTMPARMQEIYRLHYEQGLSYDRIASRLGISTSNVTRQIYKARQKLKDALIMFLLLFWM